MKSRAGFPVRIKPVFARQQACLAVTACSLTIFFRRVFQLSRAAISRHLVGQHCMAISQFAPAIRADRDGSFANFPRRFRNRHVKSVHHLDGPSDLFQGIPKNSVLEQGARSSGPRRTPWASSVGTPAAGHKSLDRRESEAISAVILQHAPGFGREKPISPPD